MKFDVQGRTAYAYTGGKPWADGERCVVFIHGALNDHSVWTLLARWYAHHGYRVLAVDQPGHGRSDGPPLASVEALADWVLALLDAAGVPSAHLVGHSMGSLIALEAASRAPGRVGRARDGGHGLSDEGQRRAARHGARRPGARDRDGQRVLAFGPRQQAVVSRPGRVAARRRAAP